MGDISKDLHSTFPNELIKALINISYTANWLNQIADKKFKQYDISSQQYNVLRILRGAKSAITVNTVRERMIKKSPNTTRLMDKLCAKNLIDRKRCNMDKRVVYVEITKKGLELINSIPMNDENKILKNITVEEAEELNRILDKIR